MELRADIVVVFADLAVGLLHFGFCSSARICTCRGKATLTWYLLVIWGLGDLGLVGISGVLGGRWWTAVSRDEIEDGSKLVDDAVTLCKKSSVSQRDPST